MIGRSRIGLWALVALAACGLAACGDGSSDANASYRVGLVTNNPNGLRNIEGFRQGMADLDYVDGADIEYVAAGEPVTGEALDRELERLVAAEVDLVFTAGTPTGVAAKRVLEGSGIPVVFGVIADPLGAGVMTDLDRPGGDMTGIKLGVDQVRRLELLAEMVPSIERILVPYNPGDSAPLSAVDQIIPAAPVLGVELVLVGARSDDAVDALLANGLDDVDAVFLVPDSLVNAHLPEIVDRAIELGLPVSGPSTAQVEEGALMTYGFVHEFAGAQAARIADQVLQGADPGDLPVEDTESFLSVNLTTAEAIGVDVSDAFLRQAEIIRRSGDPAG